MSVCGPSRPSVGPPHPRTGGGAHRGFFWGILARGLEGGDALDQPGDDMRLASAWAWRSAASLDGLVPITKKTVMRRVEFGGTLFLVAVIGVLLTSREEGDESS